jgi:hypothetical protein
MAKAESDSYNRLGTATRGIGSTLASSLWWVCASPISCHTSFAVGPFILAHAILDVIVEDKVELNGNAQASIYELLTETIQPVETKRSLDTALWLPIGRLLDTRLTGQKGFARVIYGQINTTFPVRPLSKSW